MLQRLVPIATFLLVAAFAVPNQAHAAENPVVAKVNGLEVMHSDIVDAHKLLPEQYRKIPFDSIFPTLLDSVIDTHLSAADARKQGFQNKDSFKKEMARIERQILQRNVISEAIEKVVTEAAVKDAYEQMKASATGNEEVHARHILLKEEKDALAVIAQLDKGKNFADLAKAKSTGPSGPSGGDLGYFGRGQMVPDFEKAAFALEKGTYSTTPVKTQFGYHVILQEDKRAKAPPAFAEVEENLRTELSQAAGAKYMTALRKAADIEKFLPKPADAKAPEATKKAN